MSRNLEKLFYPESVAIIGVSRDVTKMGGSRCLNYLIRAGFRGKLYPINRKYDEILGLKCYKSIEELPEPVDVALIAIPARSAIEAARKFVQKGVKNIVIFASGFAETGVKESLQMQEELKSIALEYGVNICGPNGQGVANFKQHALLTFSTALEDLALRSGGVGLITQSGAIGTYILEMSKAENVGIALWASTGNEVDLEFADYGQFMLNDDDVKVIAGYIEGVRDGGKFTLFLEKAREKQKPVILLKVGRTEEGSKVALSHTASMTGSDEVYDAVFAQHRVLRAETLTDLMDWIKVFSLINNVSGNRLGIVTTSGGIGVLATDFSREFGLQMAELTDTTKRELAAVIGEANARNPVDIGAVMHSPGIVERTLNSLANDPNVDILVYFSGAAHGMGPRIAGEIVHVKNMVSKPVVVGWVAPSKETRTFLVENKVPFFEDHVRALKSIGRVAQYFQAVEQNRNDVQIAGPWSKDTDSERTKEALEVIEKCDGPVMSERDSKRLLSMYGIPTTKGELAASVEEAIQIAQKIGYPLVAKIESPDISHKTEAKGVMVNIRDDQELERAFLDILRNAKNYNPSAKINGVFVQQMAEPGLEMICGVNHDVTFGKYLLLGRGGIEAELYKDVACRMIPIRRWDVQNMIQELKVGKILNGYRNRDAYDIEALIQLILNLSQMMEEVGSNIKELDLNPVRVYQQGVQVLDARIVLQ